MAAHMTRNRRVAVGDMLGDEDSQSLMSHVPAHAILPWVCLVAEVVFSLSSQHSCDQQRCSCIGYPGSVAGNCCSGHHRQDLWRVLPSACLRRHWLWCAPAPFNCQGQTLPGSVHHNLREELFKRPATRHYISVECQSHILIP